MSRFIVLLRGINVGSNRSVPMADLKKLLGQLGFSNITTYIQSGNVLLESHLSEAAIAKKMQSALLKRFGFEVKVFVISPARLSAVIEANPFIARHAAQSGRLYFTLLEKKPQAELAAKLNALDGKGDELAIVGDVVYLFCPNGYGRSVYSNTVVEKTLQMAATTRNLATMKKMEELASS